MKDRGRSAWAAWFLAALFYFYQYSLRSSPAVMMPQLSGAFGLTLMATASLAGVFYYGYSLFSLVAGAAMDRLGSGAVLPVGALAVGCGSLLFGSGNLAAAGVGRFIQGVGGAFAFVGVVFIASRNFPPWRAATLIGAGQMFGMAGGSAGQFLVGPMIGAGVQWHVFWTGMGIAGIGISAVLLLTLPKGDAAAPGGSSIRSALKSLGAVFRNPQSILCGGIAGLLFLPTTIFDMTWGVRFLQDAHGVDYASAVLRSASVPLGWMIGCPLLGALSDRIGRRKPVIALGGFVLLVCLAWILYGRPGVFPAYVPGLAAGISSGAAMVPYTVIKEANPPQLSGSAAGVINFLNLTLTALLGPVFASRLQYAAQEGGAALERYRSTFEPLLYGVGLALVLTLALKETGDAARAEAAR